MAAMELIGDVVPAFTLRKLAVSVFFDFSKAFDCVSHELLLKKLYRYGFRGVVLNLIKSYLAERRQFVRCDDADSGHATVGNGVPQGSILGPLFYILYVNDVSYLTLSAKLIMYADDTVCTLVADDMESLTVSLQQDINLFHDWACFNKLKLNASKTKGIFFTPRKIIDLPVISINDNQIEFVKEYKYLGVLIDESEI